MSMVLFQSIGFKYIFVSFGHNDSMLEFDFKSSSILLLSPFLDLFTDSFNSFISFIIPEYQYNRLIGFYDPDNEIAERVRYQQENSVLAIAGGGLTGKGLNNDSVTSVKNADFISAPETDFIFTIIGEELGFIGSMAVLILLFLIVIECIRTGMRARENIGRSISIGFGALIGFQTIINLAVVTRLIPNTGLTLPFVSAGMSSLIVLYMGVGIVLNTGLRMKNTL